MRRWGIVLLVSSVVVLFARGAHAQPAAFAPTPAVVDPLQLGFAALPGGLHVDDADEVPVGQLAVSATGGFGYRKGLLAPNERFGRVIGDLAASYAPIAHLSFGVELDGRYDRHYGLAPSPDDGYVGDPHFVIRGTHGTPAFRYGVQVGVWLPGANAPSITGSAISVDGTLFATLPAGPGRFSISAGYRFDNSAQSVTDRAALSPSDQVSLGDSGFDEVFGGLHYVAPLAAGKAYVSAEASIEAFVGTGAPSPIFRGTLSAGYHFAPGWALLAFVEGAKDPDIKQFQVADDQIPLAPYEPLITGGLAIQGRFGGPSAGAGAGRSVVVENSQPQTIAIVETADVSGEVRDHTGQPIAGAKITVKLKTHTGTAVSDDHGAWTVAKLPIGKTVDGATTLDDTAAEIDVEVDGKKPGSSTMVLAKGANAAQPIALESLVPSGQLRGIVKALASGKPIADAQIAVTPGGQTIKTAADGTFQLDLQPGQYKITVTASGMANQDLDVTIDPNGVAVKNIDMHR